LEHGYRQSVFPFLRVAFFVTLFLCLLPMGCSTTPEPRVIADRVFPGDRLEAVVTTFPGDPGELTITSCNVVETSAVPVEITQIEIEGRPGWRLRCGAPTDRDELTLKLIVQQAGRRFSVTIPFRRRVIFVAGKGRDVKHWTTRRERITDLGPAFDNKIFLTQSRE
jgi:hypothetical protein